MVISVSIQNIEAFVNSILLLNGLNESAKIIDWKINNYMPLYPLVKEKYNLAKAEILSFDYSYSDNELESRKSTLEFIMPNLNESIEEQVKYFEQLTPYFPSIFWKSKSKYETTVPNNLLLFIVDKNFKSDIEWIQLINNSNMFDPNKNININKAEITLKSRNQQVLKLFEIVERKVSLDYYYKIIRIATRPKDFYSSNHNSRTCPACHESPCMCSDKSY